MNEKVQSQPNPLEGSVDGPEGARINPELLEELCELSIRKRDLDAELKDVKERIDAIGGEGGVLTAQFIESGFQSFKSKRHNLTVYLHAQGWAKVVDGDTARAVAALKADGLGDLVAEKFNTNTVSSQFREWDRDEIDVAGLYPNVAAAFEVVDKIELRTRKG